MHAHIVLAHPEPRSFNAHLAGVARRTLKGQGWSVSLSDLYAEGFDPSERAGHYRERLDPERFDVQAEQAHASERRAIPAEVGRELAQLDLADLLILQYPMWWHMPPAMLKGWMDRVFMFGEVYARRKRFEVGRFVGKQAMLSVTVGTSADTYSYNGRSGDIELILWPVNMSLAYVGYRVLAPFVAYGVEGALRYSPPEVLAERFGRIATELSEHLGRLADLPEIPFNRMADWGPEGRIVASAPAYSPFIRHRKELLID